MEKAAALSDTIRPSRARSSPRRLAVLPRKKSRAGLGQPKPTTTRSGAAPAAEKAWNSPGGWKMICPWSSLSPAVTSTAPLSTYSSSQKSWLSPE